MTNFSNLSNFVNSFLRNPPVRTASNIVANDVAANDIAILTQATKFVPTKQTPNSNVNRAAWDTSLVIAQMSAAERSVIVKEFLDLPSELKELIDSLRSDVQQSASQTAKNAKILTNLDLAALMTVFRTNGKAAQEKLFQLVSSLKQQGNVDTEQFQELQSIINACIPMLGTNQAQFLKNLILLYLPWLPVGEQNNFEIEFTNKDASSGSETDDTVTLLIQTKNFGNVKVVLTLVNSNKVDMQINCSKLFPKDRLEELLKRDFENYCIDTDMEFFEQEILKNEDSSNETKIHMNTSPKLSPYLLLAAHSVIRSVIDIDKSHSLVAQRKGMVK